MGTFSLTSPGLIEQQQDMWWGHVLPANGQGTWISGSRGSDAQTNLHSRIPEALPHHHILHLLITWAGRETPAWAPDNVVNLDVTCFGCGLHSRARESFCRKYSILMMFMVTDIRMGEFCECCQAGWPVIGSHLVSENWPSVKGHHRLYAKQVSHGMFGVIVGTQVQIHRGHPFAYFSFFLESCTLFAFPFI